MTFEEIRNALQGRQPRFETNEVVAPRRYLLWIDILGTKSILRQSSRVAAVAAGKLHASTLRANRDLGEIARLYPVVDGLYVTAEELEPIINLARKAFYNFAATLICADNQGFRFLIRGAITKGPLVEGVETYEACSEFDEDREYANKVLMGRPLIEASDTEKAAPPFGIRCYHNPDEAVDETFPYWGSNFRWWDLGYAAGTEEDPTYKDVAVCVKARLDEYYESYRNNPTDSFPIEKVEEQNAQADAYFDFT